MSALWSIATFTFVATVVGTVSLGTLRVFGVGRSR
jgi:hypothetical protein